VKDTVPSWHFFFTPPALISAIKSLCACSLQRHSRHILVMWTFINNLDVVTSDWDLLQQQHHAL